LGFPPDWVYESAFGPEYRRAVANRTEDSPLVALPDIELDKEHESLSQRLNRPPTDEEFVMYLNHPGDALKTIEFRSKYGDPNNLPLDVWFEGLLPGVDVHFADGNGKPHLMTILHIARPDSQGMSVVRYVLDSEYVTIQVKVAEAVGAVGTDFEPADPKNPYHVASPSNGDLWIMYVNPGKVVKAGEELFNISIMKQEKAVLSPVDGIVKRVLKFANYQDDKKMVPVKEGEMLVELGPVPRTCLTCKNPVTGDDYAFCPSCGQKL